MRRKRREVERLRRRIWELERRALVREISEYVHRRESAGELAKKLGVV